MEGEGGSLVLRRGAVLAFAMLALANPLWGQGGSRLWRAEERVILRDYGNVNAVAASNAGIFAATSGGLVIYDPRARRWLPPVTELDGFPGDSILTALADPADHSLWFGTTRGVVHYVPVLRQFEEVVVPGGVRSIVFDRDDPFRGPFLGTDSGWMFLPRGSPVPQRAAPPPPGDRRVEPLTVDGALQRYPTVDAMKSLVLMDESLQRFRYTSTAIAPLGQEVFFGTDGRGLLRYETGTATFEALPFGLPGNSVGSVVAGPEGVWVGTSGAGGRSAFARVADDLQQFEFAVDGKAARFSFDTVHDLVLRNDGIWAGTDRGLVRADTDSIDPIDVSRGAPTSDVYAVAGTPAGVWVGTAGGLAFVADDMLGGSQLVAEGGPVTALAVEGDSLWVGGVQGLALVILDEDGRPADSSGAGWFVPPDVMRQPILREPVIAVAVASGAGGAGGGHAVAATRDRVVVRSAPPQPDWSQEVPLSGQVGEITSLAADSAGVWIAGKRGLGFFDFATGSYRTVTGQGDLPGVVGGIAVGPEYVWVGTDGGLVRFTKNALVP
jgi:ligand-binding sensor domain-containing protein